MSTTQAMGLGHFLEQTDAVGMTLFVILLAMSVASWTVIVSKVLRARRATQTGAEFLARFQNSTSIDDLKALIADHPDARSQIAFPFAQRGRRGNRCGAVLRRWPHRYRRP
ncbi:MAG: hypothetical protein ACO38M_04465, partial [Burkholderiaceae bacterium]